MGVKIWLYFCSKLITLCLIVSSLICDTNLLYFNLLQCHDYFSCYLLCCKTCWVYLIIICLIYGILGRAWPHWLFFFFLNILRGSSYSFILLHEQLKHLDKFNFKVPQNLVYNYTKLQIEITFSPHSIFLIFVFNLLCYSYVSFICVLTQKWSS